MPFKKTAILQFQIVSTKLKSFVCANPAETENSGQMRGSSDKIVMIFANATELYRQVTTRNLLWALRWRRGKIATSTMTGRDKWHLKRAIAADRLPPHVSLFPRQYCPNGRLHAGRAAAGKRHH